MRCIFNKGEVCYANPPIDVLVATYRPEEEIQNKYCKTEEFRDCPRFIATIDYLKASKGK